MASTSIESLSDEQKLKVTVLCDVRKICEEVGSRLRDQVLFDKEALELISELVWRKIQDFGADLELFARHGKRTYINPEDVKLLVRKNQNLKDRMVKLSDELTSSSTAKKRKKDKDTDSVGDAGFGDSAHGGAAGVDDMIGNFDIDLVDLDDD